MFQHRTRALARHNNTPNLSCCLLAVGAQGTKSAQGGKASGCSRCAKAEGTRSFFTLFQPLLIEVAAGWWSAHGKNLFISASTEGRKEKKRGGGRESGRSKNSSGGACPTQGGKNASVPPSSRRPVFSPCPSLGSSCSPVGSSASASCALHKSCTLGTLNSRRPPCRRWPRSSGWSWSASGACAAPRTRQRSGPGCHPECSGRSSWQSPGRPLQRVHPFLR